MGLFSGESGGCVRECGEVKAEAWAQTLAAYCMPAYSLLMKYESWSKSGQLASRLRLGLLAVVQRGAMRFHFSACTCSTMSAGFSCEQRGGV